MLNKKSLTQAKNLALLARTAARIRNSPELFDEDCRRAADRLNNIEPSGLAILGFAKKMQLNPVQIDLLVAT